MLRINGLTFRQVPIYLYLIFVSVTSCKEAPKEAYQEIHPVNFSEADFMGSISCKECHEEEYKLWEGSHHDLSMKLADSTSVLGDFNNTVFEHKGVKSTFFMKDGDYYINTTDKKGEYQDYKIVYTFGWFPLQQYIIAFPNGEYQCALVAWDSELNKWFHLQPNLDLAHDEWMNWTGRSMSWNTMCVDCHSTDLSKNYDDATDSFNTTFTEINVSCEACHGPMSEHNSFFEKYKDDYEGRTPPETYMPTGLVSKELVDKCARCHSRRGQLTNNFDYEGEFVDHYNPRLLESPQYFLDGQILDEDYVYASFVQSKMYANGISCRDCHDVHSLKLKKEGNDLCMQCHVPSYNTPEHHFHKIDDTGGSCINCHMTGRYYMVNDFRRDHSFRVPRPDQSAEYEQYGIELPNACTGCHTDKTDEWAADWIVEKYGPERADHFSDHLLKGYFKDNAAFLTLIDSVGKYPDYVRATAMSQYSQSGLTEMEVNALGKYLRDPYALVRNETVEAYRRMGRTDKAPLIEPLLNDSLRVVRVSAARYYAMQHMDISEAVNGKEAFDEFMHQMELNSDFASGQLQKALYYDAKGDTERAIQAYLKSLQIDNRYNRSRMNLALIYYGQGLYEKSEELYLEVAALEPEFSDSFYMLGLLYNEMGQNENSLKYLGLACEKDPKNENAFYNYALKLQEVKKFRDALKVTAKGIEIFPNNERILYVKLISEMNLKMTSEATMTCVQLIQINPQNQNYKQILMRLQQGLTM